LWNRHELGINQQSPGGHRSRWSSPHQGSPQGRGAFNSPYAVRVNQISYIPI